KHGSRNEGATLQSLLLSPRWRGSRASHPERGSRFRRSCCPTTQWSGRPPVAACAHAGVGAWGPPLTGGGRRQLRRVAMNGRKHSTRPSPSIVASFIIMVLLISTMIGAGFLARESLSELMRSYTRQFGAFVILTGFVGISLIAAVVMFGVMRSTGLFRQNAKQ